MQKDIAFNRKSNKGRFYKLSFKIHGKWLYWLSKRGADVPLSVFDEPGKRCGMFLITIAFNHEGLIRKQIEMVKMHVKDNDYRHIIADNSTDSAKRRLIKEICAKENVEYVEVPSYINKYNCTSLFWNGNSHGAALNWLFYHFIKPRRPIRFAFLDHDIFPTLDCNMTEVLGNKHFIGVPRVFERVWYLWPGWCIFNFDKIEFRNPDFLPVFIGDYYLDSGGSNYLRIYKHYKFEMGHFARIRSARIKRTKKGMSYNDIFHSDSLQLIDEKWLHLINGSNCAKVPGKEDTVNHILENMEDYSPHPK